jgi:hypothetical protein
MIKPLDTVIKLFCFRHYTPGLEIEIEDYLNLYFSEATWEVSVTVNNGDASVTITPSFATAAEESWAMLKWM